MGRKKISEKTELQVIDNSTNELFNSLEETKPVKRQIGYLPSFFTTASLPFKNIHKTTFVRKGSNGVTLTLSSPKNVPYGRYGRLLLSILTTHAVISPNKNNSLMIEYASMADLLKDKNIVLIIFPVKATARTFVIILHSILITIKNRWNTCHCE